MNIIKRIREVFRKLIGRQNVRDKLGVDIVISDKMLSNIELWSRMYINNPPWTCDEVQSLNLPASIASEISRLATMEMKSEISGVNYIEGENSRADFLNKQYQVVLEKIRTQTEYAAAKGGLILKPYITGDEIGIDFVQAEAFAPIQFDSSGNLIGCIFYDYEYSGGGKYTRLEVQRFISETQYQITNTAYFKSNTTIDNDDDLGREVPLTEVPRWASLEPEVIINDLNKPLFAYLKMPFANSVEPGSPLGVSVYARAVDLIKEADKQYSRLLWEFESGQRALYVETTAFRQDRQGNPLIPFKRLMKTLNFENIDKPFFEDWTPTLREENILRGLDNILSRIEDSCGLARGTFSQAPESNAGGAKTATELKIMRQRTYATIMDVQHSIQGALEQLVWAMDKWTTIGMLAPDGEYEMSFEFDDSIAIDRQAEFQERMQLLTVGAIQAWELRAWYLGETSEQAQEALKDTMNNLFPEEE